MTSNIQLAPIRGSRLWLGSGVGYVISAAIYLLVPHIVETSAIFWLPLGLVGPFAAAMILGRPPRLLPLVLFPAYFAIVAVSASDYDQSRWSYSGLWPAGFILVCQLAVALLVATKRPRRAA